MIVATLFMARDSGQTNRFGSILPGLARAYWTINSPPETGSMIRSASYAVNLSSHPVLNRTEDEEGALEAIIIIAMSHQCDSRSQWRTISGT